jgi:hypothetical protein
VSGFAANGREHKGTKVGAATEWRVTPKRLVPRAPRFALKMPVLFRPVGTDEWRQGLTENVSRSGVLFRTAEAIHPRTPLEIKLVLPLEIGGQAAANVHCRGEVVRAVEPGLDSQPGEAAVAIFDYQFAAGQDGAA